ncbi:non-ribosomal peptide synthetase, partial [Endozoicomonas sp. SM1973]
TVNQQPLGNHVSIGQGTADTALYVLNPQQQLLPMGCVGELYIGGAGLARGYLNQPELTAERFIPNPFASENNERLYRTGDLVRWLPDGNLAFIGRVDHQVKIRGFRIELGEIETALIQQPQVADGVVIIREDQPGDKRLVAYVVPNKTVENEGEWVQQLRQDLKVQLPDFMLPGAFAVLPALPTTPNGKVDRKALPSPIHQFEGVYTPPATETEQRLVEAWQAVLELNQTPISTTANFFELGGNSILVMRLNNMIQQTFKVELAISLLFEKPTIQAISAAIEEAENEQEADYLLNILDSVDSLSTEALEALLEAEE